MKQNVESTSKELKIFLNKEDTIVIDWEDLKQAYFQFKKIYGNRKLDTIIDSDKVPLCLKMHQELSVIKTMKMKKKILWGHIQRSGKSYIIGGCVIEDSKNKTECNYLVITTAIKETNQQYHQVFNYLQFKDFNVRTLKKETEQEVKQLLKTSKKNIIIISDMYIKNTTSKNTDYYNDNTCVKIKKIKWLKDLNFEFVFLDESHKGGTTEMAHLMMNYYGHKATQVFVSATYSKPSNSYNIPKNDWILWDIEDIKLCRENNVEILIEKHGQDFGCLIEKYGSENIITEYSKYPDLWVLTDEINDENLSKIIEKTLTNNYGWSLEACFLPKQGMIENELVLEDEFQNEAEMLKVWYRIFGKKDEFNISSQDFPDSKVFIKRIENICKTPPCSRFMKDGDFHKEPMIIMAFLPQKNIDIISKATIKLLKKHKVLPDYLIVSINSKITNDPKKTIEYNRNTARIEGKKGVLVLSGKQYSLGVSIDNCDIVLLLNNNTCFDMINQMMFRSMTEGKNKKYGFVVDLNIHRSIETSIINYATVIKPDLHPVEATKYILREKLINLNGDHWMESFGNHESKFDSLCNNLYKIYSSNTEKALSQFLNRLRFKEMLFSIDDQKFLNNMFTNKISKEVVTKLVNEEKIKKGIEKTKVENNNTDLQTNNEKEKTSVNYMELLKHIIPLLCLLTIHDNNTSFIEMFKVIEKNSHIHNILIDQTKTWWGKNIDSGIIKIFISIYIKYMKEDKETKQIIRSVKELFIKNINNSKELSKLIDKYLIPQELEKKNNAEVSTPFKLRQEMLDKIPDEFWTSKKKVFEPCAGKGGFIIDIIDRFMNGLEEIIPDEKERYKTIVEECLYFSDINSTNIFICKLLTDPCGKYKLNYNEGNTLELDIKEKWGISGFDAVIGNPPYNDNSGNKGKGHTLWTKFIEISLEKWINDGGYLLYVNPSLWRQADHPLQTIMKQYQIEYLEIHDETDGVKIFNCSTRYDWYLISKVPYYKNSEIKTQIGEIVFKDLSKMNFIPNYNYDFIDKLVNGVEKINILHSESSYEVRKKWMSHTNNEKYKYPCVYSINRKNDIKFKWSSLNSKGMFGKSKVIFGSGATGFIIDENGEYGLTQWATGIEDKIENLNQIKNVISSTKFMDEVIKATSVSKAEINRKILKYFKKDFWKEFVPKQN